MPDKVTVYSPHVMKTFNDDGDEVRGAEALELQKKRMEEVAKKAEGAVKKEEEKQVTEVTTSDEVARKEPTDNNAKSILKPVHPSKTVTDGGKNKTIEENKK